MSIMTVYCCRCGQAYVRAKLPVAKVHTLVCPVCNKPSKLVVSYRKRVFLGHMTLDQFSDEYGDAIPKKQRGGKAVGRPLGTSHE